MAKKGASKAKVNDINNPPKDELALKKDAESAAAAEGASSSTPKDKKKDGVKQVDGVTASGGSGRKVRIVEDSPAGGVKRRASASKKGKTANDVSPVAASATPASADTSMEPAADPKFSPKHKDKTRGQPEKSALKKQNKKRKAEDNEEEAADDSAVQEAETSMAALSTEEGAGDETAEVEGEDGELDFLAGFESGSDDEEDGDGADNSDEEDDGQAVSVKELPEPKQAGKKPGDDKKKKKAGKGKKDEPGVIYLGRIPHGFHEDEMKSYFSQFGDVTRLRLSRNRATGASKHYAFIEFAHSSVATIVAETMNNYLLHGHILQCKTVPQDQVHPKMWIGANRKFRVVPKGRVERLRHNAPKTQEQKDQISTRLVKREEGKRTKLKELGIEYDFDGYVKTLPAKQIKDQKEEKKALQTAKKLEDQVKKDSETKKGATGKAGASGKVEKETKEPARASKRARKSI